MKVVLMSEWDNPKDLEKNRKRLKFNSEISRPYWNKLVEEKDIKVKISSWSDNSGRIISWIEFETVEDFSKIWDDERWQQMRARWAHLVYNARIRLLRPGLTISEDLRAEWK